MPVNIPTSPLVQVASASVRVGEAITSKTGHRDKMKGSWLCYMVGVTTLFLGIGMLTDPTVAYVTSFPDEPDIDGKALTVGIAIGKFLAGFIPYPGVGALVCAVLNAFAPKQEEVDYWENIKDNVAKMCGDFINEHNLEQVEVYKGDLVDLLQKYNRAPIHGSGTYPDKNMMANAITTSIVANRYLIEAAEKPWSMSIDFVDVSNIHVLILKDAADIYSSPGAVSLWWVDLSKELAHYIQYGIALQNVTRTWRDTQIECYFDEASKACLAFEWAGATCYDEFMITDEVTSHGEKCIQLHPDHSEDGSCAHFCRNYQVNVNQDTRQWIYENVGSVIEQMEVLKLEADEMAKHSSLFYNTYTEDK